MTKRLHLRAWKESDLPGFIAMNQDPMVMEYFPSILNEAASLKFYERIQQHVTEHGFSLYAVEETATGSFLGFTGFMIPTFEATFTPCVEIGWRFRKEYWKKGFATEAAKACLDFGFEALQFREIYAFTSVHNRPSENVMKRIGMEKEGEFRHPHLAADDPLSLHVLYRITKY